MKLDKNSRNVFTSLIILAQKTSMTWINKCTQYDNQHFHAMVNLEMIYKCQKRKMAIIGSESAKKTSSGVLFFPRAKHIQFTVTEEE